MIGIVSFFHPFFSRYPLLYQLWTDVEPCAPNSFPHLDPCFFSFTPHVLSPGCDEVPVLSPGSSFPRVRKGICFRFNCFFCYPPPRFPPQ